MLIFTIKQGLGMPNEWHALINLVKLEIEKKEIYRA